MFNCKICDKEIKTEKGLSLHLNRYHKDELLKCFVWNDKISKSGNQKLRAKYSRESYYLNYLTKDKKPTCKICGKEVNFINYEKGFKKLCSKCNMGGFTLEKAIINHGEVDGKKMWESYCNKQSVTNTFEYKHKKYGWNKEQFEEYNNSRAITIELCVKRHGGEKGKEVYKEYCDKQAKNGNKLEYFIEKYGEIDGTKKYKEIVDNKRNTLDNFIKRHGKKEGIKKYDEYLNNSKSFYSKIATKLFKILINTINDDGKYYHSENEYGMMDIDNNTYYKYDFTNNKKIIEFNGEKFHPKTIDDINFQNPYKKELTSKEVWLRDRNKQKLAEDKGFEILYIWENEYNEDRDKVIEKCLTFLSK